MGIIEYYWEAVRRSGKMTFPNIVSLHKITAPRKGEENTLEQQERRMLEDSTIHLEKSLPAGK